MSLISSWEPVPRIRAAKSWHSRAKNYSGGPDAPDKWWMTNKNRPGRPYAENYGDLALP